MAFSLVACGGNDGDPSVGSVEQNTSASEDASVTGSITDTESSTDLSSSGTASSDVSSDASTDTSTDTSTNTSSKPSTNTSTNTSTNSSTTTDTGSGGSSDTSDKTVNLPETPVANLALAGDQYNQQVLVYDMDKLAAGENLDNAQIWSCDIPASHIAGLKYREDTVFGDVILVAAGAGKGKAYMVSYPEGKILWSTNAAGNNPHCIEILPSGNIIVASSTGGTLRLFKTAALLKNDKTTAAKYVDTALYGAHGVLWDPEYDVLWGLGDDHLRCYTITGTGTEEALKGKTAWYKNLPADGGHAIAADLTDPDFMYITVNSAVYRFNKKTRTFIPTFYGSTLVSQKTVKGIAQNQNNNFTLAIPNGGKGTKWETMGYGGWCTDTLIFCHAPDGMNFSQQVHKSAKGRAFYKIVTFCGEYL